MYIALIMQTYPHVQVLCKMFIAKQYCTAVFVWSTQQFKNTLDFTTGKIPVVKRKVLKHQVLTACT